MPKIINSTNAVITNSNEGALLDCDMLSALVIPDSMKNVPSYFFRGNNLTSLIFKQGVECIASYAITTNCSKSVALTVPKSVTKICDMGLRINTTAPTISMNLAKGFAMIWNKNSTTSPDREGRIIYPESFTNYYEKPYKLTVNSPYKQIRPIGDNAVSYANTEYRVDVAGGEVYVGKIAHKEDIQIVCKQSYNKAVHTNDVCYRLFDNVTNNSCDMHTRSIEFPNLTNTVKVNLYDDKGYEIIATGMPAVSIRGHRNNTPDYYPCIFDNGLIVTSIHSSSAVFPPTITIEGLPKLSKAAEHYVATGAPVISGFNNCSSTIYINNTHYVSSADTQCLRAFKGRIILTNVNYAYLPEDVLSKCDTNGVKYLACSARYAISVTDPSLKAKLCNAPSYLYGDLNKWTVW